MKDAVAPESIRAETATSLMVIGTKIALFVSTIQISCDTCVEA